MEWLPRIPRIVVVGVHRVGLVRWILFVTLLLGPACASLPTKPLATVNMSGKVTDSAGRPIPGVEVLFQADRHTIDSFYPYPRATTDSSGEYRLSLAAGTWTVGFFPPRDVFLPDQDYLKIITLSPDHSRFYFVIAGFRVEGRVISPTGAVLDSAYVIAAGAVGYASNFFRNGRFSLLIPASDYDFSAGGGYYSGFPFGGAAHVPIRADTTFDITLTGDPITGLVSGPGVAPLESTLVVASGQAISSRVFTGPDGRYTLYVPPGDYRFLCYPRAADSYILIRIFPLRSITGATVVDLGLTGIEWSGTVRSSATLQPIQGAQATATLFADAFNRTATATTDALGQFRLVLEPNREYSLGFSAGGMVSLGYPDVGATTADTTFDILLDPLPTP
jgi:hypothetical protein